jgi:hypothetical protein
MQGLLDTSPGLENLGAKHFRPIGIFLQQRLVLNDKSPRLRIDCTRSLDGRPEERIYRAIADGFVRIFANRPSTENDRRSAP